MTQVINWYIKDNFLFGDFLNESKYYFFGQIIVKKLSIVDSKEILIIDSKEKKWNLFLDKQDSFFIQKNKINIQKLLSTSMI